MTCQQKIKAQIAQGDRHANDPCFNSVRSTRYTAPCSRLAPYSRRFVFAPLPCAANALSVQQLACMTHEPPLLPGSLTPCRRQLFASSPIALSRFPARPERVAGVAGPKRVLEQRKAHVSQCHAIARRVRLVAVGELDATFSPFPNGLLTLQKSPGSPEPDSSPDAMKKYFC